MKGLDVLVLALALEINLILTLEMVLHYPIFRCLITGAGI